MDVELLYIAECPNWRHTLDELRGVMAARGVTADVRLVEVKTWAQARRLRFGGSPTVRVDGRDVDPAGGPPVYGVECRLYLVAGKPAGAPPREWMDEAVRAGAR